MAKSYNEKIVTAYYAEHGIPAPIYEYKFCADRLWRFDLAWVNPPVTRTFIAGRVGAGLAIEVQGGLFSGGRHNRGAAMLKEYEKLNKAACLGWRILYVQPRELCMASTVLLIKEAFGWL